MLVTTKTPGENGSDHFVPFEAVNSLGVVMLSIRTLKQWAPIPAIIE